ncbi:hypothetical protein HPB50_001127 [Hyalomma asiaticum]|uniref:Uncharacterized protein n=1 Tax=Hyalomma asiaticum TaxID=266040 RepID=A0ACB7RZM7_HYAAI|nr:hypothetical protein HPB50_001127 [Hyalomma asiaticum]
MAPTLRQVLSRQLGSPRSCNDGLFNSTRLRPRGNGTVDHFAFREPSIRSSGAHPQSKICSVSWGDTPNDLKPSCWRPPPKTLLASVSQSNKCRPRARNGPRQTSMEAEASSEIPHRRLRSCPEALRHSGTFNPGWLHPAGARDAPPPPDGALCGLRHGCTPTDALPHRPPSVAATPKALSTFSVLAQHWSRNAQGSLQHIGKRASLHNYK